MRQNYWQKLYENCFYHIYNRSINKETLFRDEKDKKYFMEQWQYYLGSYMDTYAYSLMRNHFHFIAKVKTPDDDFYACVKKEKTVASFKFVANEIDLNTFLEDQFKRFFTSIAATYKKKYNRQGSLFQKRFKRIELSTLFQILDKICYVHHNPIHHSVTTTYEAYEYSSYRAYLSDKPTKISRLEGLELFSDKGSVEFFVQFHKNYHDNWRELNLSKDFDELGDE
jgi:putative transposase